MKRVKARPTLSRGHFRKGWAITVGCVLLVVAASVVALTRSTGPAAATPDQVAVVDGHVLTTEELALYSQVNSLPLNTQQEVQAATTAAVRFKVMQVAAFTHGIVGFVDYPAFLESLREKNSGNDSAAADGSIVYGVTHFSAATYYAEVAGGIQHGLLAALLKSKQIDPRQTALMDFYLTNKAAVAKKSDTISLELIRIDPTTAGQAQATAILAGAKDGKSFEPIFQGYRTTPKDGVGTVSNLVVTDANASSLLKYQNQLIAAAVAMKMGDTTMVVDDLGPGEVILHCTARAAGGYRTFDESQADVTLGYENQQFQEYLDGLVGAATIVIDHGIDPAELVPAQP